MSLWRQYRRELILLGLLLAMLVVAGIQQPSFVSPKNLDDLWQDAVLLLILALAQMPVIMARGIDLSVAANIALTGMLVGLLGKAWPGAPVLVLLASGALIGALLGTVNAMLINVFKIPPIVATLGMMSVFRGLTYVVSGGQWINSNELSAALVAFPNSRFLGLTGFEWLSIVAVLLAWLFMHHSRLGREVYALGGNPTAARYVGINEPRIVFTLYTLSGAVAGFVGVLWVARYALASTELASGFELQVVAACVLGGVSIAGGMGSVYGTALGALFLVTLYNALPTVGISPFWQTALIGVTILVAAVVNQGRGRAQGKQILRQNTHSAPELRRAR
jgi:rhamnose transport system permease protein